MRCAHRSVLLAAALPAFAPLVSCLTFNIWAPAAVVWETFGVHYTALPTQALGYHFIGNAMAYAVVYAYPPSALVHGPLGWLPDVERFQFYTLVVYAWHGALVTVAAFWVSRQPIPTPGAVALVLVTGALPPFIATSYANWLTPNYYHLASVLYLVAGGLWARLILTGQTPGRRAAFWLGALAALAVTTKLTWLAFVAPFLLAPLLSGDRRCLLTRSALAALGAGLTTVAVFGVYFVGHVEYAAPFARDMLAEYTTPSGFLVQRDPALLSQLWVWPQPASAVQGSASLATICLAATVLGRRGRPVPRVAWLVLTLAASLGYARFLDARAAPNSFVDAVGFLAFVGGTTLAVAPQRVTVAGTVLAVLLAGYQSLWVFDSLGWIETLRAASRSARAIHAELDARPDLPVVYYWPEGHGLNSVFWPSTYLYALLSGRQDTKQPYLARYVPRAVRRQVAHGPYPGPHVAVVMERRQDGSGMPLVDVLGRPDFAPLRPFCHEHAAAWGWTFRPPPPAVVSVCVVTSASGHATTPPTGR